MADRPVVSDRYLQKIDVAHVHDASRIAQFRTRREAEDAARSIGWSALDATRINIMGFYLWAIVDSHGLAVTNDGLIAWRDGRWREER